MIAEVNMGSTHDRESKTEVLRYDFTIILIYHLNDYSHLFMTKSKSFLIRPYDCNTTKQSKFFLDFLSYPLKIYFFLMMNNNE